MKTTEQIAAMEAELKDMKKIVSEYDKAMYPGGAKGHEATRDHLDKMRIKFPDHWMFNGA